MGNSQDGRDEAARTDVGFICQAYHPTSEVHILVVKETFFKGL